MVPDPKPKGMMPSLTTTVTAITALNADGLQLNSPSKQPEAGTSMNHIVQVSIPRHEPKVTQ